MIEMSRVSKSFDGHKVLDDLSFSVAHGELVGLLGANGAGKTTLMDILCGCLGADEGQVMVGGVDIVDNPLKVGGVIGYLPDESILYDDMRVNKYLEFCGSIRGIAGPALIRRVEEVVDLMSLEDVSRKLIRTLSKGFRQRVGIAQAMIHDPEILVLDEPTEGLDPSQISRLREFVKSLRNRKTVLLSSHILAEVQDICDRSIILDHGNLVDSRGIDAENSEKEMYRLKVTSLGNLDQSIGQVPGCRLSEVSRENHEVVFSLESEEKLPAVMRLVCEGGHRLREISVSHRSLEDIYLSATTKNRGLNE